MILYFYSINSEYFINKYPANVMRIENKKYFRTTPERIYFRITKTTKGDKRSPNSIKNFKDLVLNIDILVEKVHLP